MKKIIQEGIYLSGTQFMAYACHTACFLTPVLTGSSSEGLTKVTLNP